MVATSAALLLLAVIIPQLYGLVKALKGRNDKASSKFHLPWCSPAFQDDTMTVQTGNCDFYDVFISANRGVGYIMVQGVKQREWLQDTIAIFIISLLLEIFDGFALLKTNERSRCFGTAKVQRPWTTMFSGLIV
jgi:hypothetical protein